ncbi:MAG: type I glutamate--ammonia ligase [Alphaproteobacteria bacterium]
MSQYSLSFKSPADFVKYIKEQDVRFVDFNFTDLRGKWQHTTQHVSTISKDSLDQGFAFDGSSIAGWQDISKSDLLMKPDLGAVTSDPFAAQKTLKVFCDIYDPISNSPYSKDPRNIAKTAESYMKKSGLADAAHFGPEPEFFIFDDVKVKTESNHVSYHLDSEEGAYNSNRDYSTGNMGHRPSVKGGYFPESPVDSLSDIRAEMLTVIEGMGVSVEKHHHEVAPSQCELGIRYAGLLKSADNVQIYKHAVHNVANSYGKSATFMPKPINGDNGSGMHVHQSLWKSGKPLFSGKAYSGLSETALYYIGGIMKHARALNAFTNPTTNSYKRLVPGFEAPCLLAYSALNRSASCRIPHSSSQSGKRVEIRFPDPLANPYLAFAAMLMAGLDGVENKIHPGDALESNLYDIKDDETQTIPHICRTLSEALQSLKEDHEFLTRGNVFSVEVIESYIKLKQYEIDRYETTTHPVEVDMYYSG